MKKNLDYTNPDMAVNFRDVGEYINLIAEQYILPEKRLFRGGTIKNVYDPSVIGNPKTIFNLQKGPDHSMPGVNIFHFPISNDYEKYNTAIHEVRCWLRNIIKTIESGIEFPLYVHCLSGRDRTGVVIATLLRICGVSSIHIIEEYHISAGTESSDHINMALEGIKDIESYFKGINLSKVRTLLQTSALYR